MTSILNIPGWKDMTGEQLYVFCLSNPSTNKPIPAASLEELLRLHRYCMLDLDGKVIGPLADIARSLDTPEPMKSRLIGLLAQIRVPGAAPVKTDDPTYAGLFSSLLTILPPTQEFLVEFYKLGGGRKYPIFASAEAAEETKLAMITQIETEDAIDAWNNRLINAYAIFREKIEVGMDIEALKTKFGEAWTEAV